MKISISNFAFIKKFLILLSGKMKTGYWKRIH